MAVAWHRGTRVGCHEEVLLEVRVQLALALAMQAVGPQDRRHREPREGHAVERAALAEGDRPPAQRARRRGEADAAGGGGGAEARSG